jgi:hypothetical protein
MGVFLYPPPPNYAVIITEDKGGIVDQYQDAATRYKAEGRRVEIRGRCRSACTLALTVPNVCVGPGAVVAWHHAYEKYTHKIRPEVTSSMLKNLPSAIRNRLDGKIQEDYTPATTLDYSQLLSLGIPDCDSNPDKINNVKTTITFNYQAMKPQENTANQVVSLEEKKRIEWEKYWSWANSVSASQFGQVNIKHFCFDNTECSNNIYYWDKESNYVTAIEYVQDHKVVRRKVCRAEEADAEEMICTDWLTEKSIKYEYDLLSGRYEKVS